MNPTLHTVILVILVVLLVNAVWFTITQYFLKRAMLNVIQIFRDHQALNDESARTREELGLTSPGLLNIKWLLYYKPTAFRVLLRSGIICISRDAHGFFLSENLLAQSNLGQQRRKLLE